MVNAQETNKAILAFANRSRAMHTRLNRIVLLYLLLFVFVHMAMNCCLSLTPRPTRFTRPSLASASAILSRNCRSSFVRDPSFSSPTRVSASLEASLESRADVFAVVGFVAGFSEYSAILVRMQ